MPDRALPRTWPSDRADQIEISVKMASQLLLKLRLISTATHWVNFWEWEFFAIIGASSHKYVYQFTPDRALPCKWGSERADRIEISVKMASQLLLKLRQIYCVAVELNFENFARWLGITWNMCVPVYARSSTASYMAVRESWQKLNICQNGVTITPQTTANSHGNAKR